MNDFCNSAPNIYQSRPKLSVKRQKLVSQRKKFKDILTFMPCYKNLQYHIIQKLSKILNSINVQSKHRSLDDKRLLLEWHNTFFILNVEKNE